jgi:type I restriction enzyme, S subunit
MVGEKKRRPVGWTETHLESVVEILDSQRIPVNAKNRALRKGPYPYYGANGQVDSIDTFIFDGDFALLAEDGGYFDDPSRPVAYRVNGRFWANNHVHILKMLGRIPSQFLIHTLNHADLMPFVSGTTRLKLNPSAMRKIHVPLPPLNEQKRIVARIGELQARSRRAREALESIPDLLEQLRQSNPGGRLQR